MQTEIEEMLPPKLTKNPYLLTIIGALHAFVEKTYIIAAFKMTV